MVASLVAFLAIALVAFLYSSVGHAGASGYIAVLTLLGLSATAVRPTALALNILVAILGVVQFARAGHFRWSLFWPFALLSVPAAFAGGAIAIPTRILEVLLAVVLLFSAVRLVLRKRDPEVCTPPNRATAVAVGAGVGLLSGLTGTGGGIFLTPILLFCRWAKTKETAAVSVTFIFVNSVAGLAGYLWSRQPLPEAAWTLAIAAVLGGGAGSYLGSHRLPVRAIYILLAIVLAIAGMKLLAA